MKNLWITYAWADNATEDVDFIAQELSAVGINVKLDRWNIRAGLRLWDQIQEFIGDEGETDGWLIFATENSLTSEPCREELSYALNRALRSRGEVFPVIALFPGPMDDGLIPTSIRVRLYLNLADPNWKERVKAALEHRIPEIDRPAVEPYSITVHSNHPTGRVIVEVRPRAGRWPTVIAAVPREEQERTNPSLFVEAAGSPTGTGISINIRNYDNGEYWVMELGQQATPAESLYVWLDELPSVLVFGAQQGPQFHYSFNREVG